MIVIVVVWKDWLVVFDVKLKVVFFFDIKGVLVGKFGVGLFDWFMGMVFDVMCGYFYVVDIEVSVVKVFDENGGLFKIIGCFGSVDGELNVLIYLVFVGDCFYVSDMLNNCI